MNQCLIADENTTTIIGRVVESIENASCNVPADQNCIR